jgi:hemerythrin
MNKRTLPLAPQAPQLHALCEQARTLLEERDDTADREIFHIILNDLAAYTREYFAAEEELLRQTNPAMLHERLAEHILCESQLTDILLSACAGFLDKDKLHRFLNNWWSSHTLQSGMHLQDASE